MKQIFYSLVFMSLFVMSYAMGNDHEELIGHDRMQEDYYDGMSVLTTGKPFSQFSIEQKKAFLVEAVHTYLIGFLNERGMMYWLGEEAINAYNWYQKLDNNSEHIIDFPGETSLDIDTLYRESRMLLDWLASKGIDVQQLERAREALAEKYPDLKKA